MSTRNDRAGQLVFGRLNEKKNAQDGEIASMRNLSVEEYPIIKGRETRIRKAFMSGDAAQEIVLLGTDGAKIFSITKTATTSDGITATVYKFNYDILSDMPDSVTLSYGSDLEKVTSYTVMGRKLLLAPIGILIDLDKTGSAEGFTNLKSYTEDGATEATAVFPDNIVYLCTCNNRMWGCTTDGEIYASKLGDAVHWLSTSDGLTTDSWSVDMGVAVNEPFTGCAVFNSRPVFFTETKAVTVYGDYPTTFSTYTNEVYGVMEGCNGSIAEVNNSLYYMSRWGFIRYNSGGSYLISEDLDITPAQYRLSDYDTWRNTDLPCCAGTDGKVYMASVNCGGAWENYVYDTGTGLWAHEDETKFIQFLRVSRNLFAMSEDSGTDYLYYLRGDMEELEKFSFAYDTAQPDSENEYEKDFSLLFAPIFEDDDDDGFASKKWLKFLRLRVWLDAPIGNQTATMRVRVFYDGASDAGTDVTYTAKKSGWQMAEIPCGNSYCDSYSIQLDFNQDFCLRAVAREYEIVR